MQDFETLYKIAADRKGGTDAFEGTLSSPKCASELQLIPDDRWLAQMSKCIFQAGFNWKVVENKWDDMEEVFHGFDIGRMGFMTDEEIGEHLSNPRIIRHGKKISAIRDNALFLAHLAGEHGSAATVFAHWPAEDYVELLAMLKKKAARLGGNSAMYFLRFMGVDSFILSRDVVAALIREGVVDKAPSSKKDMEKTQAAFNQWRRQSGRPLTHISRVLACTIDA
ncbi:DNA-3-methyladenine glycosylase I [Hoeflea prorocentri]|uniref:DNA-3-methyladenine glycosylase I n=1 Tax=Hoeflea prorocentri TaxID=1922333 RepID=A0A9X3UIB2_9HYPH|nr:DNA-3-methyladenine glycosylase I [Hoeflea prorocentri]MCY6381189.1 DNA-3-methyladenine glycosylase I [Hoeflea prorocentri]MDA5398989.1 DNA-3-methyladenine glycosylase I [Hoeflea prorocentri]